MASGQSFSSVIATTLYSTIVQAGAHLFDLGCKWLALNLPLGSDKPKVLSNKYITMDTVFLPNIVEGAKKYRHFLTFNF